MSSQTTRTSLEIPCCLGTGAKGRMLHTELTISDETNHAELDIQSWILTTCKGLTNVSLYHSSQDRHSGNMCSRAKTCMGPL